MNYRHIYHAGNFADVFKHAIFARLISYFQRKEAAFRILDTHAGIGLYDLTSEEAQKTGEWHDGIARLLEAELTPVTADLLAPFLQSVRTLNPEGGINRYPGSPMLARHLMRPQDRLSAIELHPEDAGHLQALFSGDHQVRVTELDGWLSLGSHLPPKERRGLILVDPPFERDGEFDRMVVGLARAWRRFATGTYCFWYPLKKGAPVKEFHGALEALKIPKILCAEMSVKSDRNTTGLTGTGMIIVNPPFTLKQELHAMLPEMKDILAQDRFAGQRCFWIRGEHTTEED
ncbi:23S rRNA (adenine(2030)-N(6))-methyltransferase RlmJ [Martelella sp. HB161492]|uniref:23S rRNA (adenine(2030)-N(6))-methyltransferase RlmJ n=1 Tax=Martelella sp. HB161492 TaxID=2720726 RepID=UPI001590F6B6|nr:23S rRNA (adenine(2030)-N(6))-methyltransferase RlmJ [Martelella sp. HB161492]